MAKNVNREINGEMREELLNNAYDVANDFAKTKGFENIEALKTNHEEIINSKSTEGGKKLARDLLAKDLFDLSMLILSQSIGTLSLSSRYDLVDMVFDGFVKNGNAKQYIEQVDTGASSYDPNSFVPNEFTKQIVEEQVMKFLNDDGQLNEFSYQYKKSIIFVKPTMIEYFLSGKLDEYILDLINQMYKNYKLFAYAKLCTLITSSTPQKTINGTSSNLWESLNNEILPLMEALPQENNIFNYSSDSKLIRSTKMENVLFICSNKIASLIRNGIKTQLFNQELFGASGKLLTPENITTLGQKLVVGDQNTAISDSGTEWVDDNTIYVIDISGIKHWLQINEALNQKWADNMADQHVLHVWGHIEILKWCRMFKYTNPNLSKLPE